MKAKEFLQKLFKAIKKYFFNPKWRCLTCGKEIFDKEYFCKECMNSLPFNNEKFCNHCGRALLKDQNYCTTCKNKLTSLDKCRSVFTYAPPISTLIKGVKYNNRRYVIDCFARELSFIYFKNYFNADYLTFVPMTKKAVKKRGFNQSEELAKALSSLTGVAVFNGVRKEKDTERQATLNREERQKNLKHAYRILGRKQIKNKVVVIVDDVTTTGATAQALAEKLKSAGAKSVCLVTVASVPPIDKY